METIPVPTVDLIKDSLTHLLTLTFTKSSSQSYRLAVNIAEGASKYHEFKVGNHTVHAVAFDKTREEAARAVALLQYVSGWKSTQICGGGKILQDTHRIAQVLKCYLQAAACGDWKAHCYEVIDDPFANFKSSDSGTSIIISAAPFNMSQEVLVDEYIFPCSFLTSHFRRKNQKHPSDPIDQVQAAAISVGCDLCPFFDAKGYKKVGQRKKTIY